MATKANTADDRVEIFVPKGAAKDDPNLYIGVGGVNYVLPKGKKSVVPACVAKEYYRSLKAQERMDENIDKMLEASK